MNLKANSERKNSMSIKSSLTIMFEDPFWVGYMNDTTMGNMKCVKLLLVQSQKTMRCMGFF